MKTTRYFLSSVLLLIVLSLVPIQAKAQDQDDTTSTMPVQRTVSPILNKVIIPSSNVPYLQQEKWGNQWNFSNTYRSQYVQRKHRNHNNYQ